MGASILNATGNICKPVWLSNVFGLWVSGFQILTVTYFLPGDLVLQHSWIPASHKLFLQPTWNKKESSGVSYSDSASAAKLLSSATI
jgi:hypothetical protein